MARRLALVFGTLALALAVHGYGAAQQTGGQSLAALQSYGFRLYLSIERAEAGQPTQIAELLNTGAIAGRDRYHGNCRVAIGPFELTEEVIELGNDSFVRGPDTGGRFIEETPDLCDSGYAPASILDEVPIDVFAFNTLRALQGTSEQRNGVAALRYDLTEAADRDRLLELARELYTIIGPNRPPRELTTNSAYHFQIWVAEEGRWPVAIDLALSFPVEQRTFTMRFSLDITDANSPAIRIEDPTFVNLPAVLSTISVENAGQLGLARSLRGHGNLVNSVTITRDGSTVVSGSEDHTVRVWDIQSGQARLTMRHESPVNTIALSPDGRLVAAGDDNGGVRLWEMATGRQVHLLTGHLDWVWAVAFSPDGKTLASGSEDATIKLWDVESGNQLRSIRVPEAVNGVAFTPDGRFVVSTADDNIPRLWDAATGDAVRAFIGHTRPTWGIAFAPGGETLATSSLDGTVRLWNLTDGRELRVLRGHDDGILSISWSADGSLIASTDVDGETIVWEAATGRRLTALRSARALSRTVFFAPDQKLLLTAGEDRAVRLWAVLETPPR